MHNLIPQEHHLSYQEEEYFCLRIQPFINLWHCTGNTCYEGTEMEHYCCYKYFTPETKENKTADLATYFPEHRKFPQISSTNIAIKATTPQKQN